MRKWKRPTHRFSLLFSIGFILIVVHLIRYLTFGLIQFEILARGKRIPEVKQFGTEIQRNPSEPLRWYGGQTVARSDTIDFLNNLLRQSFGALQVRRLSTFNAVDKIPFLRQFKSARLYFVEASPVERVHFSDKDLVPTFYRQCPGCDTISFPMVIAELDKEFYALANLNGLNAFLRKSNPITLKDMESIINLIRPKIDNGSYDKIWFGKNGSSGASSTSDNSGIPFKPSVIETPDSRIFAFYSYPNYELEFLHASTREEWLVRVSKQQNTIVDISVAKMDSGIPFCGTPSMVEMERIRSIRKPPTTDPSEGPVQSLFDFLFYRNTEIKFLWR